MLSKNPQEITSQVFTLSIFAVVIILIMAIAKNSGFFKISPKLKKSNISILNLILSFFLFIIINIIISPGVVKVFTYIFDESIRPSDISFVSLINIINDILLFSALYIVPFFFMKKKLKKIWKEKTVNDSSYFTDIKMGLISVIISFPLVMFISNFTDFIVSNIFNNITYPDQAAIEYVKQAYTDPLYFSIALVTIVIFAPLIEELLFRGLLQNYFSKFFKTMPRIALTSLFFALIHCNLEQGLSNIIIFISLFVFSLFLGFIYEKQRSLISPIILHASFNTLNIINIIFFKDM